MNETGTMEAQSAQVQVLDPLREDYRKVKQLFEEFEAATDSEEKQSIVENAIKALQEHSYVEEKVLYPAFEPALDEEQLMNEALEEHHAVHLLSADLKKMTAGDERFDAKFTVLAENVKHHIKEEEGEMFPQVEESDLDWAYLAEKATEARQHFSTKVARPTKQSGKARKAKRPHDKCTLQSLHKKGRPRMAINIGRQLLPASTIEGTAVQNAAGEDLGEINELMIDLEKGRIAYAVLSFGGFLGLGDKLFALPWEALNISPEGDVFILNVPRAKLDNAPGFDKDNWPDMADSSWGETVHTYYGYKPYW